MVGLMALASLLLGGCERDQRANGVNINRVGIEEFSRLLEQDGCVLLDVRSPAEFAAGHIPGAKNLDVSSPSFELEMRRLDPAGCYLVYCHSGRRSRRACGMMEAAGFVQLHDLAPGYSGWASAGKPVER
jgi:rhodanese-related sulfurtransferase